jgi:hypothetical protein
MANSKQNVTLLTVAQAAAVSRVAMDTESALALPDKTRDKCREFDSGPILATYDELNNSIREKGKIIAGNLGELLPELARMQALLSQRGNNRKEREQFNALNLPTWMQYFEDFRLEVHLEASLRTVQRGLRAMADKRQLGEGTDITGKAEPLNVSKADQRALLKAQVVINDVVFALDHHGDVQTPLAEYKKVAVSPAKLDSMLEAQTIEQSDSIGAILELALEAFEIINGELGDKLLGSESGKRLVALAQQGLEISAKQQRGTRKQVDSPRDDPANPKNGSAA